MSDKVDFKKSCDAYRAWQGTFRVVDLPERSYLMVDGHGDPNTSTSFGDAIEALYPVAYKMKFASKRQLGRDYVVPPLEGLWWADDMDSFTTVRDKSLWHWTLMIMVPGWIDEPMVTNTVDQVGATKLHAPLAAVRFASLAEGTCVQTLHVGAFDDEAAVLDQMHREFLPDHGLEMAGTHHEIYLSDFRRVAADKRRTILRQPVQPSTAT